MTVPNAFLTSNKQDYATPWPLVEAIETQLGRRFTLDVCASEKSAKAPEFYTKTQDGLSQNWRENDPDLCWCNPEYGDGKIRKWIAKAKEHSVFDDLTTVFLLPANKVDQPWWHDLVIPNHSIWTVKGRVDFLDPETGAPPKIIDKHGKLVNQTNPQASLIVVVGPNFGPCKPFSFVWR